MIIGIPKEIKDHEDRVALLPAEVKRLKQKGHRVLVERHAGIKVGVTDQAYRQAGATIVSQARDLYGRCELVVKVKEPLPAEYGFFRSDLILFCFLHLAANRVLARRLRDSGITALGYETLEDRRGGTPLLKPMSEIAGRLSVYLGAHYLRSDQGGKGILLSPTHYSDGGRVTIVGGGNVGRAAAEVAVGLGAQVDLFDLHPQKLKSWAKDFPKLRPARSTPQALSRSIAKADLVVGAVYVHGARTPQVIRSRMVKKMEPSSVLVDVAVDQGGASETTRPTSLSKPVYLKYGVIHCAVTNLPALVSRTASQILSKEVLPYVERIGKKKTASELVNDSVLKSAVNISGGEIIHPKVKESL